MTSDPAAASGGYALASLVDRLEVAGGCRSYGHIVEIPGFGQILFGELLVSCDAVRLIGIRAQLAAARSAARSLSTRSAGVEQATTSRRCQRRW